MESKPSRNKRPQAGLTLTELTVAVAISGMLLALVVSFYSFSTCSFTAMANYTDLNRRDRRASDLISRDVRSALAIVSFTTNNPYQLVLREADGVNVAYTYDPRQSSLTRTKGSQAETLLTQITPGSFSINLKRRPTNSVTPYEQFPAATNLSGVKLIGFQWAASRTFSLATNLNSASQQTAQVSIRNQ